MPARVHPRIENTRLTDSRCAVVSDGSCVDGPPALPNVLGFTLEIEGTRHVPWTLPVAGGHQVTRVAKLRGPGDSAYAASSAVGIESLLQGGSVRSAMQSFGLRLAGDAGAVGELLDLAQLPDLDLVQLAASAFSFSSTSFVRTCGTGGCGDAVHDPASISFVGHLDHLGLAPPDGNAVPEPGTLALAFVAALGLAGRRSLGRRAARPRPGR